MKTALASAGGPRNPVERFDVGRRQLAQSLRRGVRPAAFQVKGYNSVRSTNSGG
jgi:hypothetical protein